MRSMRARSRRRTALAGVSTLGGTLGARALCNPPQPTSPESGCIPQSERESPDPSLGQTMGLIREFVESLTSLLAAIDGNLSPETAHSMMEAATRLRRACIKLEKRARTHSPELSQVRERAATSEKRWTLLSRGERDVARFLIAGYTNANVGARLGVSINTVKTIVQRIYRKLAITNRVELLRAFTYVDSDEA